MANFGGDRFELAGLIAQTPSSSVFRARDLETGCFVALKILHGFYPDDEAELFERYRELGALRELQHPRLARHLTFDRWNDTYYIVEEYHHGFPLPIGLDCPTWNVDLSLEVVTQLAEALEFCHARGILHLEVRPANVLLATPPGGKLPQNAEEVDVRLLALGRALILGDVGSQSEPPERVHYRSPEQLGVIDRKPDPRADIYSLGVLLYRALTGRVPYQGEDNFSIAHKILSQTPPSPRKYNRNLSSALESVVLRALARDPDERFSSMEAFRSELLATKWAVGDRPSNDSSIDLQLFPNRGLRLSLIERHTDLKRIYAQFDKAAQGRGSFVLVTGEPGSGKTRLIEELRSYALANRGLFLWCQATEFESNRPFSPLRDALRQFVQHGQGLSAKIRCELKERIARAVGGFGKDLVRCFPEIEELVPTSGPEPVSLEPEREHQRLIKTILNLLDAIGGAGLPVLLFLDDYQWVDEGTRSLVERLKANLGETNLLLVCTENRSEPGTEEGLHSRDREAGEALYIHLNPLSQRGCRRLFEAGLGHVGPIVKDLATVAYERCGGNPRLLMEIIKTLRVELKSFKEEGSSGLLRLQSMIPDANVEAFVHRRWTNLSPSAQEVITAAAVIGRKFSLSLLERIVDRSQPEVHREVNEAIENQIVTTWTVLGENWHCFSHERVHEAVYESISPEAREKLHRRTAEALEEERKQGGDGTQIYDVAFHYLRGDDPEKGREAALRAAYAAKKSFANREAIHFFSEALRLLSTDHDREAELRIFEDLGDSCALDGQYDEAEVYYYYVLHSAEDPVHKARLEGKIGDMCFRRGMNDQAIEHMRRGLSWLGLDSPRSTVGLWISIAWNLARQAVHTVLPRRLLTVANGRIRNVGREATKILHSLAYAYYFLDQPRTLEVHLRQLNLAERLGESHELAHTYSSHGIVCSLIPLHRRAIQYQRAGLEMRKRLGDRWGVGQSYAFLGVCCYYRTDLSQAVEYLKQSIRILEEMGDQWEIEAAYSHLGFCYNMLAEIDAAERADRTLLKLSREIRDLKFIAVSQVSLADSSLMRGDLETALEYADEALGCESDYFTSAMAMRVKGQILLRMGRREEALNILEDGLELIQKKRLRNEYLVPNYVALAQARLDDIDRVLAMGNGERRRYLGKTRQIVYKGLRLARKFQNHLGYALRIRGVYHRLSGRPRRAERDFAHSCRVLKKQGRLYELGLTLLESARWKRLGGDSSSIEELERAVEIFRKVGARRDLEAARELLGAQGAPPARSRNEDQQLGNLFRISRSISSILDLNRLIVQITDLAVDVTDGEKGYLFLNNSDAKPELRCARGANRNDISIRLISESMKIINRAWESGVAQVTSLGDSPGAIGHSSERGCSIICVPLRLGDKTFGLIYVENGLGSDLYTEDDLEFLTVFASQAAVALQNAILYKKAEELNLRLEQKVEERTQELLKSKQDLENANRLKSEFLANMSHELRTPLNAIIAMSEILAEKTFGDLAEKQEVYVQQILDSGIHLLSLINDVLDLSKVEAGQIELDLDLFSLNDLLKSSLVIVKERANRKGVTLEFDPDDAVDIVRGDARRIKQVVFNLLSNAVKFTPEGGRVTLSSAIENRCAIVCVEDTGIGISKQDQLIIFDEFRQVDSSYSRQYEGTGLGLALSRKFVEMHDGRIWVESDEGRGSRFYFSVPLDSVLEMGPVVEPMAVSSGSHS